MPHAQIINGNSLLALCDLPKGSVHCCVTSPPYYGLRDYGVDGQIGMEETMYEYVESLVKIFREVKRVLRTDGTVWLNLGDTFAANRGYQVPDSKHVDVGNHMGMKVPNGLKPKDLMGIPWRVALALQDDGWYLRSDIIWAKPNPLPESVSDRPTKSHEYIFLLTQFPVYYYDAAAIAEPAVGPWVKDQEFRMERVKASGGALNGGTGDKISMGMTRNKRDVWEVPTFCYSDAHFATFPPKLIEPCILSGTSEKGVCPTCGNPWSRITKKEGEVTEIPFKNGMKHDGTIYRPTPGGGYAGAKTNRELVEIGWEPGCDHGLDPIPATVLDIFSGAATTGMVALRNGRNYLGIELNPEYVELSRRRLEEDLPMFNTVEVETRENVREKENVRENSC